MPRASALADELHCPGERGSKNASVLDCRHWADLPPVTAVHATAAELIARSTRPMPSPPAAGSRAGRVGHDDADRLRRCERACEGRLRYARPERTRIRRPPPTRYRAANAAATRRRKRAQGLRYDGSAPRPRCARARPRAIEPSCAAVTHSRTLYAPTRGNWKRIADGNDCASYDACRQFTPLRAF